MKGKIVPGCSLALVMLFIALVSVPISGAANVDQQWWKISFQVPVAFSTPQKVGLDAAALVYPPESGLGQGQMEITLVAVPKDMAESLGNQDAEILTYVKTTFLGATAPVSRSVERSFLGKKVAGAAQSTSIPKKGELEIYLIPLSDGDKVAVAFSRDTAFARDKADSIITTVAQSFKEAKGQ
jgi:hypothetical protein